MGDQCAVTNFDNQSQMDKMMNGGVLYGTICFPKNMPKYIFLVVFPPMYFLIDQFEKGRIISLFLQLFTTVDYFYTGLKSSFDRFFGEFFRFRSYYGIEVMFEIILEMIILWSFFLENGDR